MKFLCLFFLALLPLVAQPNAGSTLLGFGENFNYVPKFGTTAIFNHALVRHTEYSWGIYQNPDGTKSFYFVAYGCDVDDDPPCAQLSIGPAEKLAPVAAALKVYYNLSPNVFHHPPVLGPFEKPAGRAEATSAAASAPDPQMVFFDGLADNLIQFDLTTSAVTSQVPIPTAAARFAIRPSATGLENEVWVANGGLGISIVDLGAQKVLTNILSPSIPQASAPSGIVFTPSGATAFEAVGFSSTDSAGNNGAIVIFDAVQRTVKSTVLLKTSPAALIMSPDGLTVYWLDRRGMITYYDILSGTGDLSVSTYTPGQNNGYGGSNNVFIHPDGTRLFWNVGTSLSVFDLTTRKGTGFFSSGLPTTAAATIQMAQNGATVWFTNTLGNVVVLDTRYGNITETFQSQPGALVLPGLAY